jgi:hypothetical protein
VAAAAGQAAFDAYASSVCCQSRTGPTAPPSPTKPSGTPRQRGRPVSPTPQQQTSRRPIAPPPTRPVGGSGFKQSPYWVAWAVTFACSWAALIIIAALASTPTTTTPFSTPVTSAASLEQSIVNNSVICRSRPSENLGIVLFRRQKTSGCGFTECFRGGTIEFELEVA